MVYIEFEIEIKKKETNEQDTTDCWGGLFGNKRKIDNKDFSDLETEIKCLNGMFCFILLDLLHFLMVVSMWKNSDETKRVNLFLDRILN